MDRRQFVKASAWSVPVTMAAVAVPLAAASTAPTERIPVECTPLDKTWWQVAYNDGTTETLHQGDVNRDKTLQALCRDKGPKS